MSCLLGFDFRRCLRGMALTLAAAFAPAAYPTAAPDAIVGTWLTDEGASKIEVASTKSIDGGTVYSGKVVWLKEPARGGKPLLDANNADPALRERPIMGLQILSAFKAGAGGWGGGTVYSPRAGKSFPADLAIASDGRLQLKVKAGLLSRTEYWTR
jgi:uncharacterized protein (DUF2147 family)